MSKQRRNPDSVWIVKAMGSMYALATQDDAARKALECVYRDWSMVMHDDPMPPVGSIAEIGAVLVRFNKVARQQAVDLDSISSEVRITELVIERDVPMPVVNADTIPGMGKWLDGLDVWDDEAINDDRMRAQALALGLVHEDPDGPGGVSLTAAGDAALKKFLGPTMEEIGFRDWPENEIIAAAADVVGGVMNDQTLNYFGRQIAQSALTKIERRIPGHRRRGQDKQYMHKALEDRGLAPVDVAKLLESAAERIRKALKV